MAWRKFPGKYGAKKTEIDGRSFASMLEASVYSILKSRERAGELKILQCQDHVYLTRARIGYVPDFKCETPSGEVFWVEAKGFEASRWPTIKKLWKHYGPGALEIWKGSHQRPSQVAVIAPSVASTALNAAEERRSEFLIPEAQAIALRQSCASGEDRNKNCLVCCDRCGRMANTISVCLGCWGEAQENWISVTKESL